MKTKFFIFALIFVVLSVGCAFGAIEFYTPEENNAPTASKNFVENDPKLKPYDNPTEFDVADGQLHISFKGVFRGENKDKDFLVFVFVVTPQKDMRIFLNRSEMYDNKGTKFDNWNNTWIGKENTTNREIIANIPIKIERWLKVPLSESSALPTIARVNFAFNDEWFQFRNIKVKELSLWENLRQELGL